VVLGNNLFGNDVARVLKQVGKCEKRTKYILMDRVNPQFSKNYIVSKGVATEVEIVNELGIYGVFLA